MTQIATTAEIHPTARLGHGVIVGEHAQIGAGCRLDAYAIVGPYTQLGTHNHLYSFAVIGGAAQDHRTDPDAPHRLICGQGNIFREGVTVSRGSEHGGGVTEIGNDNLLMAHAHIGHDVRMGHHNTLSNGVSVAGHVNIGNRTVLSGHCAVHQFVRIGELAFLAANAMVSRDVPPFCSASGDRAKLYGLNRVGLRRAGLSVATRQRLHAVYRQLFISERRNWRCLAQALVEDQDPHIAHLAAFCLGTERGLLASIRNGDAVDRPMAEAVDTD
ncbi:MAG: acyl-ACP--UDP-N-acetylglucosamine O-acyltransferase [Myxococcota bacterium]|nr:acyl-ACP--UDP-N-acetylglucosamine O-acyltransferase [Myxococcota bacterium]